MKKYCNKKNIFIASLALIIIIYFISILVFGNKSVTLINQPYDNLLKKQPRLQDDFYDNINYKYLSKNKLSVRSTDKSDFDCSLITKEWFGNGGGRKNTGGAQIPEEKLKLIQEILFNKLV